MSDTSASARRYPAAVPAVRRWPIPMVAFAGLLLVVNVFAVANFLFNMTGFMPGLATGDPAAVRDVSLMLAGRHLGPVLLLLFALLYRDTRVMQLAWTVVIVREVFDLLGTLAAGGGAGALGFVVVVLVLEVAALVYTSLIASGRVAGLSTAGATGAVR